MGIAFDASSDGATSTGADFNWSHAGGASAKAALVLIIADLRTVDEVLGVTYGGVAMSEVAGSPRVFTAGPNDSVIYGYFLNNCGGGSKTVAVDLSPPGAGLFRARVVTVTTDGGDVEVVDTSGADTGASTTDDALAVALDTGAGRDTVDFWTIVCGEAAVGSLAGDQTNIAENDYGNEVGSWDRADGAGDTITCTWTFSNDTAHGFGVALGEVSATIVTANPAAGWARGRSTATASRLVGGAATGRARGRAATTALAIALGRAQGRARGRAQVSASATVLGQAQGRARGRSTANGGRLGAVITAAGHGHGKGRGTARAAPVILSGTLGSDVAGTTFTVDVTRACTGAPLLIVAAHDGTPIGLPVPSGGGITSYEYVPHGFSSLLGDDDPRAVWNIELHGPLDGSDITITFPASTDGCRAALIDCLNPHATTPFIHAEGLRGSLKGTALDWLYHQLLASRRNTLISTWAVGRSGSQSTTWDTGMTELYDVDPGSIVAFAVAYITGGLADHRVDVTFNEDAPHAPKTLLEFVEAGEDTGSPAYRRELAFANAGSGTSRTTAVVQPTSGQVMAIAFLTERAAASADPTAVEFDPTGTPVAFTKVAAVNVDADHRLHIWAHRFTSTPAAAGVRMTFAASQIGYAWHVWNLVNTAGSTDTDWCDVVTGTGTGTDASADQGAVAATSGILGVFGKDAAAADWTPGPGFVPMDQADHDGTALGGTAVGSLFVGWSGSDGDASPSAAIAASADWAAIALEVFGVTATTVVAAAHGRARGRGTATGTVLRTAASTGRGRGRSTAAGTVLRTAAAAGRSRGRSTATALQVASAAAQGRGRGFSRALGIRVQQAAAQGRARGRATVTSLVVGLARAVGRARGRATATSVITVQAAAVARGKGRAQATGTLVVAGLVTASAHGRSKGHGTAVAAVTTVQAAARGHARGRGTATGQVVVQASAQGRSRGRARAISTVVITAAGSGRGKGWARATPAQLTVLAEAEGRGRGHAHARGGLLLQAAPARGHAHGWSRTAAFVSLPATIELLGRYDRTLTLAARYDAAVQLVAVSSPVPQLVGRVGEE